MKLDIQINLIIFSLIYGVIFNILLCISYRFVYSLNKYLKIISSILFSLVNVLIYFIYLQKICNGIFHIYSLLLILLGYFIVEFIKKKLKY